MPDPRTGESETFARDTPVNSSSFDELPSTIEYKDLGRDYQEVLRHQARQQQATPTDCEMQATPPGIRNPSCLQVQQLVVAPPPLLARVLPFGETLPSTIDYKDQGRDLQDFFVAADAVAVPELPMLSPTVPEQRNENPSNIHHNTNNIERQPNNLNSSSTEEYPETENMSLFKRIKEGVCLRHNYSKSAGFVLVLLAMIGSGVFLAVSSSKGDDGKREGRLPSPSNATSQTPSSDFGPTSAPTSGHTISHSTFGPTGGTPGPTPGPTTQPTFEPTPSSTSLVTTATVFPTSDPFEYWQEISEPILADFSVLFGIRLALSGDGRVVASSDSHFTTNGLSEAGYAAVWSRKDNPTEWIQRGDRFYGSYENDNFGSGVAMNEFGNIVAFGSTPGQGVAHVYRYDDVQDNWEQLGSAVNETVQVETKHTYAVDLSSDGTTLAVGIAYYDAAWDNVGHVQVLHYNQFTDEWDQVGQALEDNITKLFTEDVVRLSSTGMVLAVGACSDHTNSDGKVQVYRYNLDLDQWNTMGDALTGGSNYGRNFGCGLALSSDGHVVAVGGKNDLQAQAFVDVFRYNPMDSSWARIGQRLFSPVIDDRFGETVDISSDGSTLVVGAFMDFSNGGSVYTYTYDGTEWQLMGNPLQGYDEWDMFGLSTALSKDGKVLAVTSPVGTPKSAYQGHIRVFERVDN